MCCLLGLTRSLHMLPLKTRVLPVEATVILKQKRSEWGWRMGRAKFIISMTIPMQISKRIKCKSIEIFLQ